MTNKTTTFAEQREQITRAIVTPGLTVYDCVVLAACAACGLRHGSYAPAKQTLLMEIGTALIAAIGETDTRDIDRTTAIEKLPDFTVEEAQLLVDAINLTLATQEFEDAYDDPNLKRLKRAFLEAVANT